MSQNQLVLITLVENPMLVEEGDTVPNTLV